MSDPLSHVLLHAVSDAFMHDNPLLQTLALEQLVLPGQQSCHLSFDTCLPQSAAVQLCGHSASWCCCSCRLLQWSKEQLLGFTHTLTCSPLEGF